jgi:putative endonuclease
MRSNSPSPTRPSTTARGRAAERRVAWHYRLRGYRILDANAWSGGNELDLVVRRGRTIVFSEVKSKGQARYGGALEMVGREKTRRIRRAAEAWLSGHPECVGLEVRLEAVSLQDGRLTRVPLTPA